VERIGDYLFVWETEGDYIRGLYCLNEANDGQRRGTSWGEADSAVEPASKDPILKVAGVCRGPVLSSEADEALYDAEDARVGGS
jgi:hypothetical protein